MLLSWPRVTQEQQSLVLTSCPNPTRAQAGGHRVGKDSGGTHPCCPWGGSSWGLCLDKRRPLPWVGGDGFGRRMGGCFGQVAGAGVEKAEARECFYPGDWGGVDKGAALQGQATRGRAASVCLRPLLPSGTGGGTLASPEETG